MSVLSASEKPLDCGQAARSESHVESKIQRSFKSVLASLPAESGAAIQTIESFYNANLKDSDIKIVFEANEAGEHYVHLYRNGREKPFFTDTVPKEIWEFRKAKELEQERKDAVAQFEKIIDVKSNTVKRQIVNHEITEFYINNMFNLGFAIPLPKEKNGKHVLEFKIENGEVFDTVEISQHVFDQITEKSESRWMPFIAGFAPKQTGSLRDSLIGDWKPLLDKS